MSKINDQEVSMLKEYAELKVQAREIASRLDDLKEPVRDVLVRVEAQDTPIETDVGKFTLRPRKLWTFSSELESRIKAVEQDKKTERATGQATFEEVHDVYFK